MRITRWAAAVLAAAALAVAAPAAPATATGSGDRWDRLTVYYYDNTGRAAVNAGMVDWSWWRTGARLRIVRTYDPRAAQIKIWWRQLPSPLAGRATVVGSEGRLIACAIELDLDLRFNYYALRSAAAHEAGHCLGLAHAPYWNSVMRSEVNARLYRPSWYDNRDMQAIYGRRGW